MGKWSQLYTLPTGNGDARFNKFVGGANGFATLADALVGAVPGDAILVRSSYTQTGLEIVSVSNLYIEFMPNVSVIATSNKGIVLSGVNNVVVKNANFAFNNSGNSSAVIEILSSDNCKVLNTKATANASKTFTSIIDDTLSTNCTADITVDMAGGSYANAYPDYDNLLTVNDGTTIYTTVGKIKQTGNTTNWTGYPVINSPVESSVSSGSYTFDFTAKSKFLKTGGAGTFDITNLSEGQSAMIAVSSTGGVYSIVWVGSVKWPSSSVPTPTTTAGKYDIYNFIKIGGIIFGTAALSMG